jgi:hypothetical protein
MYTDKRRKNIRQEPTDDDRLYFFDIQYRFKIVGFQHAKIGSA